MERSAVEMNLLLGVAFKMLRQVEPQASKLYSVVFYLSEKLQVQQYSKDQSILSEYD